MNKAWPAFLASLCIGLVSTAQPTVYVSPAGNDAGDGTKERPFLTIERGLTATRSARDRSTIILAGGDHELSAPIILGERDTGLTIRASGPARLLGGRIVTDLKPLTDETVLARLPAATRENVLMADLRAQGIADFGTHKPLGMRRRGTSAMELFVDGRRQTLARYPNLGWLTIASLPDGRKGKTLTAELTVERLTRWGREAEPWLYGYWHWGWADSFLRVAAVDAAKQTLTLDSVHHYGLKASQRFFARNLLCELDAPGEYDIDAQRGRLYLCPASPAPGEVLVSMLEAPILQIERARDVRIEGLTLEAGRSSGIRVRDSESIRIVRCRIRNLGDTGVDVSGGRDCRVSGCEIHDTGSSGIILDGGDRKTLAPAGHRAVGNHIHHSSRLRRTYTPAIALRGVGNGAEANRLHHAPHQAISFVGNDHVIERNEIHHVVLETDDAGAIYTCPRDFTSRGTRIRHNHLHQCGPHHAPKVPDSLRTESNVVYEPKHVHGTSLIYLDDLAGGMLVEGNVLVDAYRALLIGGGRDNIIRGNLILGGTIGIWIDARGLGWAAKQARPDGSYQLYRKYAAVHGDRAPYVTRYPGLRTVLKDNPAAPVDTVATGNIVLGAKHWKRTDGKSDPFVRFATNHHGPRPPAAATPQQVLDSVDEAVRREIGFAEIPFQAIGRPPK